MFEFVLFFIMGAFVSYFAFFRVIEKIEEGIEILEKKQG